MSHTIPAYWVGSDTSAYDDYVDYTMPNQLDYLEDPEGYEQAMAAWAQDRNGGPAFAPPTSTPYTMDSGETGQWRTAGTTRQETEGEYWADVLNRKFFTPNTAQVGGPLLGLNSWVANNPDKAQAALMAVDPVTGEPLLDPSVIAFLTGQDVPMPPRGTPSTTPGTPTPGQPATPPGGADPDGPVVNPDMDGYNYWMPSEDGTRWMNPAGWTVTTGPNGERMYTPPTYGTDWSNPGNPNGPTPMTEQQYRVYVLGMDPAASPAASPVPPAQPGVPDAQRYGSWWNQGNPQPYGYGQESNVTAAPKPTVDRTMLENWFAKRRRAKLTGQMPNDGRGT
jgi:hypothetical protein